MTKNVPFLSIQREQSHSVAGPIINELINN